MKINWHTAFGGDTAQIQVKYQENGEAIAGNDETVVAAWFPKRQRWTLRHKTSRFAGNAINRDLAEEAILETLPGFVRALRVQRARGVGVTFSMTCPRRSTRTDPFLLSLDSNDPSP